jgi:mannose-6-phosphate isomerase-like protein (cupin superfamily)
VPAAAPEPRAYKRFMTFLTHRGDAPALRYAGQPMPVLAGYEDRPAGFAAMQLTVPAHFAGPVPHAHDAFDEAVYVLRGRLLVAGDDEPQEAPAGSMFVAPRGQRHAFSNPYGTVAWVLGIWAPAAPAIAFIREVGAALTPGTPPDPGHMREIYARHASRLLP